MNKVNSENDFKIRNKKMIRKKPIENLAQKRQEYVYLLERSIETVLKKLSDKVEKVSIFGSFAKGEKGIFTDLDILIIMKTEKSFLERTKEIYSLLALPVDADILCYTPKEFEKIKDRPFFRKILKEEVVIYEKKTNRRG